MSASQVLNPPSY